MEDLYKTLGLTSAATAEEVRRAYRVLARRYHPDVNPGKASEEKFKKIAHAYSVLNDPLKRRQYDAEYERAAFGTHFERAHRAYRANQHEGSRRDARAEAAGIKSQANQAFGRTGPGGQQRPQQPPPKQPERRHPELRDAARIKEVSKKLFARLKSGVFGAATSSDKASDGGATRIKKVALLEVSVPIADAIQGAKKTVEIPEGTTVRKISVTIPPGVRNGSVIRFRRKEDPSEEVVILTRVAGHPFLSMTQKGLVLELPISVGEAIQGAKIQIPTLEEPVLLTVEAGTQSGSEVRLKGKGVFFRDGTRGDLFVRFMIRVPESPDAVGLKDKSAELEAYYGRTVRAGMPKALLEL